MFTVSFFNNAEDAIPKNYDLFKWLEETINPPAHLKDIVLKYRETLLRKDKINLPCITISANFHTRRELSNIYQKNSLICIDIDRFSKSKKKTQNPCINFELAKEFLSNNPSCIYVGYSSSGGDVGGLYAIFRIAEADRLEEYFEAFKTSLQRNGINIDESCKDYTRCRFFSYDPEAYFNPNAKAFKLSPPAPTTEQQKPLSNSNNYNKPQHHNNNNQQRQYNNNIAMDADKIYKIIQQCEARFIDITSDYNDWITIAGALYNTFMEDGRGFFHRLSALNGGYNQKECDKKFNSCKRMSANMGSIINIAHKYNIRY